MTERDLFRPTPQPWTAVGSSNPSTRSRLSTSGPFDSSRRWLGRARARPRPLRLRHRRQATSRDLVKLRVSDVAPGGALRQRATVIQQKTGRPLSLLCRHREVRRGLGGARRRDDGLTPLFDPLIVKDERKYKECCE